MKAVFAKVTNIKAFPSTGQARIEIEIPIEHYAAAVAEFFNRDVLVTQAPDLKQPYGVVAGEEEKPVQQERATVLTPEEENRRLSQLAESVKVKTDGVMSQRKGGFSDDVGPIAQWAVLRCAEPLFQEWLYNEFDADARACANEFDGRPTDEALSKAVICRVCGIKSRKELDTNEMAARLFHENIRQPYAAFNAEG